MTDPAALHRVLSTEIEEVLIGKDEIVERLTISLLTRGHVLLEGVPGVAKTTIADLFARASGLEYNRVQMTPDILPADITGTRVYRQETGNFQLQRGPIFANLVLADEINRATPKTQSALLEAMQERRVTIEGESLELPTPFMVVATQNPIEMEGTFELPEAQRDRFQFKLTAGLPTREEERAMLDRFDGNPELGRSDIDQVVTPKHITAARQAVTDVYLDGKVKGYILDLVAASRDHPDVTYGGSPRASLAFMHTAKAKAAIEGREYVVPDDVAPLAAPILEHRLVLTTEAELSDVTPIDVVEDVVAAVDPPSSGAENERMTPAVGDGGGEAVDGACEPE